MNLTLILSVQRTSLHGKLSAENLTRIADLFRPLLCHLSAAIANDQLLSIPHMHGLSSSAFVSLEVLRTAVFWSANLIMFRPFPSLFAVVSHVQIESLSENVKPMDATHTFYFVFLIILLCLKKYFVNAVGVVVEYRWH